MTQHTRFRRRALSLLAVVAAGALSACGAPAADAPSAGFPPEIRVMVNNDQTGPAGFAGQALNKGITLAVEQANSAGLFGGSRLVMDFQDAAGDPQSAVRITRTAVSDKRYTAMIGPIRSVEQLPTVPLVQNGKLPTLLSEPNAAGLNVGDYTFLAGAPITSYFDVMHGYLTSAGAKRIAVITDDLPSDLPIGDIAEKWNGVDGTAVTTRVTVSRDSQDYTAQIAQIVRSQPDAVVNVVTSAAGAALISQLRQGGFTGRIVGIEATTSAMLRTAGPAATGFTFPTRFSVLSSAAPSTADFTAAFTARFPGETPDAYAASGYDATQWLIKGLQKSGTATRDDLQRALTAVASTGFSGAQGQITFVGREMRVSATVLQWDGTKNILATDRR